MHDTPNGEVRNRLDAPAVTVQTDDGERVPLADVLDDLDGGGPPTIGTSADEAAAGDHTHPGLMTGSAATVADSEADDVAALVEDVNTLLSVLRSRGVLGGD